MKLQEALVISYRSLKAAALFYHQTDVYVTKECFTISNGIQNNAARTGAYTLLTDELKPYSIATQNPPLMLNTWQYTLTKVKYNLQKYSKYLVEMEKESAPQTQVDLKVHILVYTHQTDIKHKTGVMELSNFHTLNICINLSDR